MHINNGGARFARQEYAASSVPGLVVQYYAGVELTCGCPGEVYRRSAGDSHTLHQRREPTGES